MGANYPWVIKQIRAITPRNIEVSCTLGEVPNLPGSISLAALGAASLGVDYIKVGLYGLKTPVRLFFFCITSREQPKNATQKSKWSPQATLTHKE